MEVKVHWIIDGVAEMDVETLEEAEQKVDECFALLLPTTRNLSNCSVHAQFRARHICQDRKMTLNLKPRKTDRRHFIAGGIALLTTALARPCRRRWPDLQIAK